MSSIEQQIENVIEAVDGVQTTPTGQVTVGASLGGQKVQVPVPVKLSTSQVTAVQHAQNVLTGLQSLISLLQIFAPHLLGGTSAPASPASTGVLATPTQGVNTL